MIGCLFIDQSCGLWPTATVEYAGVDRTSVFFFFAFCALVVFVVYLVLPRKSALERHRLRSGQCRKCGYDLRASTGRCPECGTPIPQKVSA